MIKHGTFGLLFAFFSFLFLAQTAFASSPTVSLSASPASIASGAYSTLSLSTSGIATCLISGGIYGTGQATTIPTWSGWTGYLTQSTTYTATCVGSDNASYTTSTTVVIPAPVQTQTQTPAVSTPAANISISADKITVASGSSATLSTSATNAASCTIAGGIYGTGQSVSIPNWSGTSGALTQNTTFTLNCTGTDGNPYTKTTTVTITPSVTFSATPASVASGGYATLSIATVNISSCLISGGIYGTGQATTIPTWSAWSGTLTQDTAFTAVCQGTDGGTYVKTVTVGTQSSTFTSNNVSLAASNDTARLVTTSHRFDAVNMYGGWGPHLGKLLSAPDGTLWFADDTGNDVNIDPAIAYYHLVNNTWSLVTSQPVSGRVQQNTGSVMLANGVIHSYGVDVQNHVIVDCSYSTTSGAKSCSNVPGVSLDSQANYIGAALTPAGKIIVWWTTVGVTSGSLSYIYEDTSWHGPYTAGVGASDDMSYIDIAFTSATHFAMLAQGATGTAPNWNYFAAYAEADLGQAISNWQTLPGIGSDASYSSSDIWADASGGVHVFERTALGAEGYLYKAPGGSGLPVASNFSIPSTFRARFIDGGDGYIYLVYGQQGSGVWYRRYQKSLITGAIPWVGITAVHVDLPAQYTQQIDAIYPQSSIYQATPVQNLNFAVNGDARWGEVMQVQVQPAASSPVVSPIVTTPNPTAVPVTPVTPVTTVTPITPATPPIPTATTPTTTNTPPTQSTSCVTLPATVSFGVTNFANKQLQQFFIAQGLLSSDYATGYFGLLTQGAVQKWQTAHGVVSYGTPATTGYGRVGPKTRAALACSQ